MQQQLNLFNPSDRRETLEEVGHSGRGPEAPGGRANDEPVQAGQVCGLHVAHPPDLDLLGGAEAAANGLGYLLRIAIERIIDDERFHHITSS